ncbi:hypothetical protein BC827DRAFT_139393 [Russula dissimulans]|nr:hypothetical protein BC827DRAFT_139393 [Russula dissimulans]
MPTGGKFRDEVSAVSPTQNSRNIILCFDGSGSEFSETNSNIVRLFSILRVDRPESQVCYYQAGIGTYIKPGTVRPMLNGIAGLLDKGFAWYLPEHILDGYKFLMQNYCEGDTVCIFGFSRGAYTARALVGMLHKVGLLSKDSFEQIPFAYRIFKAQDASSLKIADRFKRTFGRQVIIDFLGVWDTVASVGLLWSPTLPLVGSNDMIKVFRHALSLDERRAKFRPNLYHRKPKSELQPMRTRPFLDKITDFLNPFKIKYLKQSPDTPHTHDHLHRPGEWNFTTDVKEVWFAGCHSDVGGGNTEDEKMNALSNVSLRWMVREIVKASETLPHFKILFDRKALEQWNIPEREILLPSTEGDVSSDATVVDGARPQQQQQRQREGAHKRRVPSVSEVKAGAHAGAKAKSRNGNGKLAARTAAELEEKTFDTLDALEPSIDELRVGKRRCLWRMLEILPAYYEWQDENDLWVGQWRWNWGSGRVLPPNPVFHESVNTRRSFHKSYYPEARWERDTEHYVQ